MTNIVELGLPASPNHREVLVPASRTEWRGWLSANPDRQEGIWVVYRKKSIDIDGPIYDDLVEEALCFGWIDSQARSVDERRRMQWFSPRRKGGLWSSLNKRRIETLSAHGLMTERGRLAIDEAKADGSWSQTDATDALIVPKDLAEALHLAAGTRARYESLPDSTKRQFLWRVYSAKTATTRVKRIEEVVGELTVDS